MFVKNEKFQLKIDQIMAQLELIIDSDKDKSGQEAQIQLLGDFLSQYQDLLTSHAETMRKVLDKMTVEKELLDAALSEFNIQKDLNSEDDNPAKLLGGNDKFIKMLADLREQYFEREMILDGTITDD